MLVDSHCHLDFPNFEADRDQVVADAAAAGIGALLTINTRFSRRADVIALAEGYDRVFCTVGTHPHDAATEPLAELDALMAAAAHPKVVGFGETGLDSFYQRSPKAEQEASFRRHIAAARATGLPVVIHSRSADAEMIRILEEEMAAGAFAGVLHCFSATPELAWAAVGQGLFISFSGILTFPKAEPLRELAAALPLERLLVETDAPYLAPVPMRGKRNQPRYVALTAACLAKARGISADEAAAATTANFFRLFAKAAMRCG
jgi:TatD DNase family protein